MDKGASNSANNEIQSNMATVYYHIMGNLRTGGNLMDRELRYPPGCFIAADVLSILILRDLVHLV